MSFPEHFDVIIIGGGIVGTATALQILRQKKINLLLLESEPKLAAHQTGNNSGVIHSGLYYKPNSLKATNCALGRKLMYEFCDEYGVPVERCGKLVVATNANEIHALNELEARGKANGLASIKRLRSEEIKEYEPSVAGVAGLFIQETGIVDYTTVTNTYSNVIEQLGGVIKTSTSFLGLSTKGGLVVKTNAGDYHTRFLINCAGLYSDRIAKGCGIDPGIRIIPFRGEYYMLKKDREYLVKNLIYPVPDPRFPFLGVHFTRMIGGGREAGPNAVLALQRTGYRKTDISFSDIAEYAFFPGFWKMASKYYAMGWEEYKRSYSKQLFIRSLQKLIPAITTEDIVPGGSGVRAQALGRDGKLLDDFCIIETENMLHVLNAPSPAATASLSIGQTISNIALKHV